MPSVFAGSERAMEGKSEHESRLPFLWPGSCDEEKERDEMTAWYKTLIALRHKHEALSSSKIDFFESENPHVLIYSRGNEKGNRVLVILNTSETNQSTRLPTEELLENLLEGKKEQYTKGEKKEIPSQSLALFLY